MQRQRNAGLNVCAGYKLCKSDSQCRSYRTIIRWAFTTRHFANATYRADLLRSYRPLGDVKIKRSRHFANATYRDILRSYRPLGDVKIKNSAPCTSLWKCRERDTFQITQDSFIPNPSNLLLSRLSEWFQLNQWAETLKQIDNAQLKSCLGQQFISGITFNVTL